MPVAYEINDQGGRGDSIYSSGCFGFFGREDDYDDFDSCVAEYARDHSTQIIVDLGCTEYSNNEALGYLTWLMKESPYSGLFLQEPDEVIQTGLVKVDLDICNQTMILGLSHLRRLDRHGYDVWNQLDSRIPSGIRAILVQILHPYNLDTNRQLGASDGDNTSTSYRYFDADALCAWVQGKPLDCEKYTEIGKYRLGFSGEYAETFSSGGSVLRDLEWSTFRTERRVQGMFYSGYYRELSVDVPELTDRILKMFVSICTNDEQINTILGDYPLTR